MDHRLRWLLALAATPWLGCSSPKLITVASCAEVGCADHQICQEATGTNDAQCLAECDAGFVWNGNTTACDVVGATCAELNCASLGRVCVNNPFGAQCGACMSGYRLAGLDCVQLTSCETSPAVGVGIRDKCAIQGRACVEAVAGEAECASCLQANLVVDPDTQACRVPLTCNNITCPDGLVCVQATGIDARCNTNCVGPAGQPGIVNPSGVCILCPPCTDTARGEAGPYLGGVSGEGRCICETAANHYWQEGEPTGVAPCDADGDGWVRFSAKAAREAGSAVVRDRAHCDFREVSSFVLHNEQGQDLVVPLAQPVILYESDRNDDQGILDQELANGASDIGELSPGRPPRAEELNSLTKYCVTALGDFNHNGVEDIDEWHGMSNPVHSAYATFAAFSYFAELHRGWYESTLPYGTYHIAEKSRAATTTADGWQVPFVRQNDTNDHWRSCTRKRDSEYVTRVTNRQGMDFGSSFRAATDFWGMTHHSQFKCTKIVTSLTTDSPPHHQTTELLTNDPGCPPTLPLAERAACLPRSNSCTVTTTAGPDPAWNSNNPSDPIFTCELEAAVPDAPAVRWVTLGFYDYPNTTLTPPRPGYLRSCVNECTESASTCEGCRMTRDSCPGKSSPGATCAGFTGNYGILQCGCGKNYGGAGCDYVCATDSLLVQLEPFPIAPREGYWMCGELAVTHYVNSLQDYSFYEVSPPTSGYKIKGEILLTRPVAQWACQAANCATATSGYIIK
jgi:hypothetical protein